MNQWLKQLAARTRAKGPEFPLVEVTGNWLTLRCSGDPETDCIKVTYLRNYDQVLLHALNEGEFCEVVFDHEQVEALVEWLRRYMA